MTQYDSDKATESTRAASQGLIQRGDFQRPRRRFVLGAWLTALGRLSLGYSGPSGGLLLRQGSFQQPA